MKGATRNNSRCPQRKRGQKHSEYEILKDDAVVVGKGQNKQ